MVKSFPAKKQNSNKNQKVKSKNETQIKFRNKTHSLFIVSIGLIFVSVCLLSHRLYINNNCKDLYFAVEYNFTKGSDAKNELLRVQYMSLISSDGENAIVEAFGLSKEKPHKSTCLKGSFKKNFGNSWYLDEILT